MRLFIAIQFEDAILDALTEYQEELRSVGVEGNYSARENLHITLAFIGEYGDPDAVLDAMEQVEFSPFEICLDGVGRFGDLFWVGIRKNPGLEAYVRRLRRELASQGIPYDRKNFSPHITLIRKISYRDKMIPTGNVPEGRMIATRVSLMKSERGKHGMVYTEIGQIERLPVP